MTDLASRLDQPTEPGHCYACGYPHRPNFLACRCTSELGPGPMPEPLAEVIRDGVGALMRELGAYEDGTTRAYRDQLRDLIAQAVKR